MLGRPDRLASAKKCGVAERWKMVSKKLSECIVMTHEWRYIYLFTAHTFNKTMKLMMLEDWNDTHQQRVH